MNKDIMKNVIVFVAGLGIGAVVSGMVLKNKYEVILEEEIESVKDAMTERKYRMERVDQDRKVVELKNRYENEVRPYEVDKSEDIGRKDVPVDDPYVISLERFLQERNDFDKVRVYYYAVDDTLVYDNEDIIDDTDLLIGTDYLDWFGDASEDPYVVYVRNERIEIDFEVVRIEKSYAETVLGFDLNEIDKEGVIEDGEEEE